MLQHSLPKVDNNLSHVIFGVWKSATRTKQTKFISTTQSGTDTIWLSMPRRFRVTLSTFYIKSDFLIK